MLSNEGPGLKSLHVYFFVANTLRMLIIVNISRIATISLALLKNKDHNKIKNYRFINFEFNCTNVMC